MTWILLIINIGTCSLALEGFKTKAECEKAAAMVKDAVESSTHVLCLPATK